MIKKDRIVKVMQPQTAWRGCSSDAILSVSYSSVTIGNSEQRKCAHFKRYLYRAGLTNNKLCYICRRSCHLPRLDTKRQLGNAELKLYLLVV